MITKYESFPSAGLEIARSALGHTLVEQLDEECRFYMGLTSNANDRPRTNNGQHQTQYLFTAEELLGLGRPATAKILTRLNKAAGYMVAINYQPPSTYQIFHTDSHVELPVIIVHASDGGRFDHADGALNVDQAEQIYKPHDVNRGDIVVQFKPWEPHRGVNPSNQDRYNMVIYRPRPGFV